MGVSFLFLTLFYGKYVIPVVDFLQRRLKTIKIKFVPAIAVILYLKNCIVM